MRTPVSWVEKVVGVFVIAVVGIVGAAAFLKAQASGLFGGREAHVLYAYLDGTYGLKEGAPVSFADAEIGAVTDVQLLGPRELPREKEDVPPPPDPTRFVFVEMRIQGEYA